MRGQKQEGGRIARNVRGPIAKLGGIAILGGGKKAIPKGLTSCRGEVDLAKKKIPFTPTRLVQGPLGTKNGGPNWGGALDTGGGGS